MIFAISPWFALCLGASAKPKSDGQPHRGGAGGGSHGSGAEALRSRTPTPPISIARWDSSYLSRTTGSDLSRSQFIPGETDRIFPAQKTAPSALNDGYPAENL